MLHNLLIIVLLAVPAIVLHELAHGWVARQLGDDTAERAGRLTLSPLKHLDPVGTIAVPLALYAVYLIGLTPSLILFGWARPVPVDFSRLKHLRFGTIAVGLAGPASNFVLAILLAQVLRFNIAPAVSEVLLWGIMLNLMLTFFNLVPIPPLDGSRVAAALMPSNLRRSYATLEPFGIIIVLVLLNVGGLDFLHPLIYSTINVIGP